MGLIYSTKFTQPPLLHLLLGQPPSPLCADVICTIPLLSSSSLLLLVKGQNSHPSGQSQGDDHGRGDVVVGTEARTRDQESGSFKKVKEDPIAVQDLISVFCEIQQYKLVKTRLREPASVVSLSLSL